MFHFPRDLFLPIKSLLDRLGPSGIPQKASSAMIKARTWRSDAVLVSVEVTDYHTGNVIVRFSFYSPSNSSGLWITGDAITPVNGEVNWSKQPIPADFCRLKAGERQCRQNCGRPKINRTRIRAGTSPAPTNDRRLFQ
jgi:hypothetical protein